VAGPDAVQLSGLRATGELGRDVALGSDPYAVLGVPRDATDSQIALARRRLSRDYHPDVNSAPDAAARFDEVQQAFYLLSDPAARAEYDRTGGHPGAARMARDHGHATEAAPGIFIRPASVDFGLLEPGQPGADAKVAVSWTGAPPGRIKSEPGNEWWTTLRAEMPDPSCVVFFLRARAHAGAPNGRQRAQFAVTLDDTSVAVQLTAEIRGVAPPPPPPVFGTTGHAPPAPGRPWAVLRVALPIVACILIGVLAGLRSGSGGGGVTASATPPVQSAEVPQAAEAAIDTRPVFTASEQAAGKAAEFGEGISGLPVQRGFEILLPVVPLPDPGGGLPGFCVAVTVPESNASVGEAGAAGETFIEYTLGTVAVRGGTDLAFPAVLPGSYVLYPNCTLSGPHASPLTLGSVTVSNLGVVDGAVYAVPGNAMVVFAVHTSGATTTVTYGAIGGPAGSLEPSLIPPANDSCVDSDYTTSQYTYWQPVQSLVSQQVAGAAEWFETGTLVFRDTATDSPRGNFYYNCAEDIPGGEPGIAIP